MDALRKGQSELIFSFASDYLTNRTWDTVMFDIFFICWFAWILKIFLFDMACFIIRSIHILNNWKNVHGRVVKVGPLVPGENDFEWIEVEYLVNENVYVSTLLPSDSSLGLFRMGSEVRLLYNEKIPMKCAIRNPSEVFGFTFAYLIFFVEFIIFTYTIYAGHL